MGRWSAREDHKIYPYRWTWSIFAWGHPFPLSETQIATPFFGNHEVLRGYYRAPCSRQMITLGFQYVSHFYGILGRNVRNFVLSHGSALPDHPDNVKVNGGLSQL